MVKSNPIFTENQTHHHKGTLKDFYGILIILI